MVKFIFATLFLALFFKANSQVYFPDSLALNRKTVLDSLPIIGYKKNIPLLFLGLYTSAFLFGFNADEYTIKNKSFFNNKKLSPYFYATNDPIVIENYLYHRKTRPLYLAGVPLGYVVFIAGVVTSIGHSMGYRPGYRTFNKSQNTGVQLMALGGVTVVASVTLRIKSFSKLRIARKRYNELILSR
jgi:hypothetical protein